jgi:hypothetical protein
VSDAEVIIPVPEGHTPPVELPPPDRQTEGAAKTAAGIRNTARRTTMNNFDMEGSSHMRIYMLLINQKWQ